MVPESTTPDRLESHVLVYDQHLERQKKLVWSPWIWKLILFGIPLILLWGVMGVFVPVIVAEFRYQTQSTRENLAAVFPAGVVPNLSWETLPVWVQGYALEIPALGVREQVVESVNVSNESIYMEALKNGVAHAQGTGLPGAGGVQYYFAHSSGLPFWGERAVTFALLHKLEAGDEIVIYRDQQKYRYEVIEKQIVRHDDVGWLMSRDGEEKVVLQTCWPIGTNWKRLLVIAQPLNPNLSGVDRGGGFGKISIAMRGIK